MVPEFLAHRSQGSILDNRSWYTEGIGEGVGVLGASGSSI